MSRPQIAMPDVLLQSLVEGCPSGLLGKLAEVSPAFRLACRIDSARRAGGSENEIPPPKINVRLLTTPDEVSWALERGCAPDADSKIRMVAALVAGGSLPALQRAVEEGLPLADTSCDEAAMGGRIDVLRWLREKECFWDSLTLSEAARSGHLETVKWMRENGCPWGIVTLGNAAQGGHLEVIKWLRENGCPWDNLTCAGAAQGGHLEVLKWLRENECPWDGDTCYNAANQEIIQWAVDNGCPWNQAEAERYIAFGEQLEALKWADHYT